MHTRTKKAVWTDNVCNQGKQICRYAFANMPLPKQLNRPKLNDQNE